MSEAKAASILEIAQQVERGSTYGTVQEDFARVAKLWSVIFGIEVTPRQVALAMIQVKVSRAVNCPHRDNWIDIAGYADCGDRIDEAPTVSDGAGAETKQTYPPATAYGANQFVQLFGKRIQDDSRQNVRDIIIMKADLPDGTAILMSHEDLSSLVDSKLQPRSTGAWCTVCADWTKWYIDKTMDEWECTRCNTDV